MSTRAPKTREHAGYELMIDSVWQQALSRGHGVKRLDVVAIAELIRDYITDRTRDENGRGELLWPHFGKFLIKRSKARNVSNPKTREAMRVPPRWHLGFRASKDQKGVMGDAP